MMWRMKMSLTTRVIGSAVASVLWMAVSASASPPEETSFLARSFPEKIGPFTRVSASKNADAIHGEILDAATAKYVSDAGEIKWSGTQFATAEQAFSALETMNFPQSDHSRSAFRLLADSSRTVEVSYRP